MSIYEYKVSGVNTKDLAIFSLGHLTLTCDIFTWVHIIQLYLGTKVECHGHLGH